MRRALKGPRGLWLAALPALLALACGHGPRPCIHPAQCSSGEECLANRCAIIGADPVPRKARREVAEATELGVASPDLRHASVVPSAVTLGSRARGPSVLYLKFSLAGRDPKTIQNAFLVLEAVPDAPLGPEPVEVRALRVRENWSAETLSWYAQPARGLPSARGVLRPGRPAQLRIDVSRLVRYFVAHPESNHGVSVEAETDGPYGVSLATGVGTGVAPYLDLYVK